MHMAVNMEPSMRYFQINKINTIPCSAAYGPQIKQKKNRLHENSEIDGQYTKTTSTKNNYMQSYIKLWQFVK
jgi:hypothetical protein